MRSANALAANFDRPDLLDINTPESLSDLEQQARSIDVLIIEDDFTDFEIVNRALRRLDTFRCNIVHAPDRDAARNLTENQTFDVVFVDFWLGLETGVTVIQELGGRIGSSAVILLTGIPGQDVRRIALQAGAIHCMDKAQINPAILETAIWCALHTFELEGKLQRTIADLERVSRAKTDFFARMGHDLKTPLNAILGYSEMITAQTYGKDKPEEYIACAHNIHAGGMHLLEVLDNLIHHSASESSFSGGRFEHADLSDLVQRAVGMVDILAKSRGHDIVVDLPDEPVLVNCQPSVLAQAVLNLLSNAVKYTPKGGQVTVSVVADASHCEITVTDNGIGMSEGEIGIALKPFQRVDLPADLAQDGTGIGLPIVADIVCGHAGMLDIDSTPGEGTTVSIRMQRVVPDCETA